MNRRMGWSGFWRWRWCWHWCRCRRRRCWSGMARPGMAWHGIGMAWQASTGRADGRPVLAADKQTDTHAHTQTKALTGPHHHTRSSTRAGCRLQGLSSSPSAPPPLWRSLCPPAHVPGTRPSPSWHPGRMYFRWRPKLRETPLPDSGVYPQRPSARNDAFPLGCRFRGRR